MRKGRDGEKKKRMTFLVATTSLPAVYRPNGSAQTTTAGMLHARANIWSDRQRQRCGNPLLSLPSTEWWPSSSGGLLPYSDWVQGNSQHQVWQATHPFICCSKIMNKLWTSPEQIMKQVMNNSWPGLEQVMNKMWTTHNEIMNQFVNNWLTTHEQLFEHLELCDLLQILKFPVSLELQFKSENHRTFPLHYLVEGWAGVLDEIKTTSVNPAGVGSGRSLAIKPTTGKVCKAQLQARVSRF